MLQKLDTLKKYIALQAEDAALWCFSDTAMEEYIQQELRRVAWLIEEASIPQIEEEMVQLRERMP